MNITKNAGDYTNYFFIPSVLLQAHGISTKDGYISQISKALGPGFRVYHAGSYVHVGPNVRIVQELVLVKIGVLC